MKKSFLSMGRLLLTLVEIPFMLAVILAWSVVTFGKMILAELPGHGRKSTARCRCT